MKKIKDKKFKIIIIASSIALIIVATVLALFGASRLYYAKHPDSPYHGWEYIGNWFNPAADGNWYIAPVYVMLAIAVISGVVILWATRNNNKN